MPIKIIKNPEIIPIEKILSRVIVNSESECWEWTKALRGEYGVVYVEGNIHPVHRLTYEVFNGKIKDGMFIDHICRNKKCCNPDHLRQATPRENSIYNSIGEASKNIRKTHCKYGHEFTKENTANYQNARTCKVCKNKRQKEYDLRFNERNKIVKRKYVFKQKLFGNREV